MKIRYLSALYMAGAVVFVPLFLSACTGQYDVMGREEGNPYVVSGESFENGLTEEAKARRAAHEGDETYPLLSSVPHRPSPRITVEEAAQSIAEMEEEASVSRDDVIAELDAIRESEEAEHDISAEDALLNAIDESENIVVPVVEPVVIDVPEGVQGRVVFEAESISPSIEAIGDIDEIAARAVDLGVGMRVVGYQDTAVEFMEQALALSLIEARMEAVVDELGLHIGSSGLPVISDMVKGDGVDINLVEIYFIDPVL